MNSSTNELKMEEIFEASESIDALEEKNPELYGAIKSIEALAENDAELYKAIKSHLSIPNQPPETAPTPTFSEEGSSNKRSSKISTFFRGQSRRFSLDTLPPTVAEIMALFDFDGNGKVTLDEVRQGAQELKASRKKNKIAIWAMVIQFLVYTALTVGSCGVLYHFLYLMKDTTVDPSTGSLMVKDGDDNDVEVSVKSHGKAFSYDGTAVDSVTGKDKKCVSASQAADMFEHVLEGTTLKFVDEDTTTGAVKVVSVGTNSSRWTDTIIDLGGLVLVPDVDCVQAIGGEDSGEGSRYLSTEDVYDAHIASRQKFMQQYFGSRTGERRLEEYTADLEDEIEFLGYVIFEYENEIDACESNLEESEAAISTAESERDTALEEKSQVEGLLAEVDAELVSAVAEIDALEEALQEANGRFWGVNAERNAAVEAAVEAQVEAEAALAAALEAKTGVEEDLANALEAKTGLEENLASALQATAVAQGAQVEAEAALAAALEAKTGVEEDLANALEAKTGLEENLANALQDTAVAQGAQVEAEAALAAALEEKEDVVAQVDTLESERDAAILAQVQAVTAQREAENELEAIEDDQTRWQFRMDQANAATELETRRKERAEEKQACYRESAENLWTVRSSVFMNANTAIRQVRTICEQNEYLTSACIAQDALEEAMDTMREAMPANCV